MFDPFSINCLRGPFSQPYPYPALLVLPFLVLPFFSCPISPFDWFLIAHGTGIESIEENLLIEKQPDMKNLQNGLLAGAFALFCFSCNNGGQSDRAPDATDFNVT